MTEETNTATLAITAIILSLVLTVITSSLIYSTANVNSLEDQIGMTEEGIWSRVFAGKDDLNALMKTYTPTNITCDPTNPTCENGIQSTASLVNTGFDPRDQQTNWGKVMLSVMELIGYSMLPLIFFLPKILPLVSTSIILTFIATSFVVLWQYIAGWAMINLIFRK